MSVSIEELMGIGVVGDRAEYLRDLCVYIRNISKKLDEERRSDAGAAIYKRFETLLQLALENKIKKGDLARIEDAENRKDNGTGLKPADYTEIAAAIEKGIESKGIKESGSLEELKMIFLQTLFESASAYEKEIKASGDKCAYEKSAISNSELIRETTEKTRELQQRLLELNVEKGSRFGLPDLSSIIQKLGEKIEEQRPEGYCNDYRTAWHEQKKAYFEYMQLYDNYRGYDSHADYESEVKRAREKWVMKWTEATKIDTSIGDAQVEKMISRFKKTESKNSEIINRVLEELTEKTALSDIVGSRVRADRDFRRTEDKISGAEKALKSIQGDVLTEEQEAAIGRARELNEAKRQKAIAEAYQEEFTLMQEHLRQYGTYQQQKLAIAAEYAEKIRKAGSEAERMSLSSERDSLISGVKAQELRTNIDWGVVFGEFGGMFTKVVEPVLADAKAYVQTDEFKNSDQASQKALIDAIREIERNIGGADNLSFKRLGQEINTYQQAMSELKDAQEEYARCYGELQEAQKAYIAAQAEGTDAEQEAAEKALATAQENETAAAKNVETIQVTAESAQRAVSDTATGLKAAMDGVVDGLQKLASGSLSGAYNGLIALGNGAEKMGGKLGKAFGKIADALEDVPIIGWIASIIDIFKDGLSVVIGGLLDAVFNAVSGILDDVLSGDLFVTLGQSILSGVGKIFDAITWGGFSSWFGSGDSDKTLERDIEYLTTSNKDLQKAINNLAEKMEEGSVADAEEVYNRQKALLEQSMDNTQEMMQRSAAAYSNGFLGIGGHKSSNHKIDKGMSSADWDRISAITGKNIRSAGAFFGLSSEDMAKVFNEANDLYSKIKSLADDGYKDASQYMDDYIEYYRQIEELQDALREKLTGMSFNTLRDNFKSQLLDMESDAESFGENLDEMLFGTIVESLMSEKYSEMLKGWYNSLADAMADDGKLDDAELAALRSSYKKIVDGAIAERDALADAIGYDPEKSGSGQSGKAGSYNAMSQDQGTKLEGLFVSVQMHVTSIDEKMEDATERWGMASDSLRRIEENTGRTANKLDELAEDIKRIIRDGIKTK